MCCETFTKYKDLRDLYRRRKVANGSNACIKRSTILYEVLKKLQRRLINMKEYSYFSKMALKGTN